MEVDGRCVLVLGGAGLVGRAVCRRVLERRPGRLVVASLTRREAEEAARELGKEASGRPSVVEPSWGDLFVPAELGDRSRADFDFADGEERVRPGRMAAWIFRYDERGERTKR